MSLSRRHFMGLTPVAFSPLSLAFDAAAAHAQAPESTEPPRLPLPDAFPSHSLPLSREMVIAAHGNPNAKSDGSVAVGLAMQAAGGARANVEINVDSVGDADYAVAVRGELDRLMIETAVTLRTTMEGLGWKGHQPPRS